MCSEYIGSVCELPETHLTANDWDSMLGMKGQLWLEDFGWLLNTCWGLIWKSLKKLHANLGCNFIEVHLKPSLLQWPSESGGVNQGGLPGVGKLWTWLEEEGLLDPLILSMKEGRARDECMANSHNAEFHWLTSVPHFPVLCGCPLKPPHDTSDSESGKMFSS